MNRRGLKEASRQCIRDAACSTKKITLIFLLSILALILAEWGITALTSRMGSSGHYLSQSLSAGSRTFILSFVISLVCQLLMTLLSMGYASFSLKLSRKEDPEPRVLLDGLQMWGKTILLHLMISVLLSLWSSLFAMPVSYVLAVFYAAEEISFNLYLTILMIYLSVVMVILSYRYRMAWFVLLDYPELSIRQVILQTKAMNKVHRFKLFLLDLSFLPWLLLCALTCGILLIWKLPYITATYAHAYNYMLEDFSIRQKRLEELLEQQRNRLQNNGF